MGADRPKQYLPLGSRTLLEWSLAGLLADPRVARVFVVVAHDDRRADALHLPARCTILRCAGPSRAQTVQAGLRAAAAQMEPDAWVLVHDAARPCLDPADLARLIDEAGGDENGGLLAVRVSDTVKHETQGRVARTVDRTHLWRALTPQFFAAGTLLRALAQGAGSAAITDESSAIEGLGLQPRLVAGDAGNIKVTAPGDLPLAEALLRRAGRW